jgi:hypothetical protein
MSTDAHDQTRPTARRRLRLLLVFVAIAAAAVVLAACGSSSSGSGGTTSSSGNNATTTQGGAPGGGRFASLRSCLQKEGINLPAPKGTPGQQPPGGNGGGPGGFLKAPEGVSQSKFQEALKKCGAGNIPRRGSRNLNSATARTALTNYATCMRENGINLPAPNTSGKGPVFNTSGINTSSETFKTAQKKCQSDLAGALGGNGGSPSGQPPA